LGCIYLEYNIEQAGVELGLTQAETVSLELGLIRAELENIIWSRVSSVSSQDSSKAEANQAIQTKPNIHQTEPSKKLRGLSYFCELSLNAQFQLPRLYVSCISTKDSSFAQKKQKLKKKNLLG